MLSSHFGQILSKLTASDIKKCGTTVLSKALEIFNLRSLLSEIQMTLGRLEFGPTQNPQQRVTNRNSDLE